MILILHKNRLQQMFSISKKKIWIAGHNGMVGSAIVRRLESEDCKILKVTRKELNLLDQYSTKSWMEKNKPDIIILAAAKVGGIKYNMLNKSSFLYENLMIQNNVIFLASQLNVEKLVFIGSSCIYPKDASQPIIEEALLNGPLEETNEGYALAKIAGLKLCKFINEEKKKEFISVMPSNVFGVNDNFDPENSHVLGALLRKIYYAKLTGKNNIEIWGSGKPRREFLYVDDLADAICFLLKNYNSSLPINIGTSKDISITELAFKIAKVLDHKIDIKYNTDMPDGTYLKRLDTKKINNLGWYAKTSLEEGIKKTLDHCLQKNIFN